ncbi:MAG: hypothetical protein WA738_16725 [Candidatus Angelobacter sp.]
MAQLAVRPSAPAIPGHLLSQPIGFEKYSGQSDIDFFMRAAGYSAYLSRSKVVLRFAPLAGEQGPTETIRITFAGSNAKSLPQAEDMLPGVTHYYIGDNSREWRTDVRRFGRVRYPEVYPGIGVMFYGERTTGSSQELEFDFDISPGRDISPIAIKIEGATVREFDGNVELVTPSGRAAILKKPKLYQLREGKREPVSGAYTVRKTDEVGFSVGPYDKGLPLIIDPALAYSTLVQRLMELTLFPGQFPPGTENFEFDSVSGIAADSSGAVYITGSAFVPDPSLGFQPGPPIIPISNLRIANAYVAKLDPTGSSLVYTAYLGGIPSTFAATAAAKIAVDAGGNAYIVGTTNSPSFATTPGTFNTIPACPTETISNKNCSEPFAAKFDAMGHLVFSTYLVKGGSTDTAGPSLGRQDIAVDSSGAIYVAGNVAPALFNFPKDPAPPSVAGLTVTPGAFQATRKSNLSGYILKLHPDGSTLDYSTYLGGSANERIGGVAADATGVAYVDGQTASTDFPTTAGAFQTTNSGTTAFFSRIKADGSGLLYSTFLGASTLVSEADGIAIDGSNDAFIAGSTNGPGFPTTTGAFKTNVTGTGEFNFVSEFDATNNLAFSTYVGNAGATGIAVDGTGVYVAGLTSSPAYPLLNSIEPPPLPGEVPMYVTKLNLTGSALVYSTLVGSSLAVSGSIGFPGISGVALDGNQNIYLGGTPSDAFPTTLGAFQVLPQVQNPSASAGFVAKVAPSLGAPVAVVAPRVLTFPGVLQQGVASVPLTVRLSNFGDADFSFTGVTIAGTNASDFAQTNNCGATVGAGTNCSVTVTFTSTVPSGTRVANLVFTFGGGLPTQTVSLTGTAGTPTFQISPVPGDFGTFGQLENSIQSFTITNTGTGALIISNASFTPAATFLVTDFSFGPTNLGPSPTVLQPGQSTLPFQIWMHIGLNFGDLAATFTIQDNAPGSPRVFHLTGFGFHSTPDFAMSAPNGLPATATVIAGQTATYNVIVASIPGFGLAGGTISVACSGAPAGASCSLNRTSLPLPDNNPETVVVSVKTTAATASLHPMVPAWLWTVVAIAGIMAYVPTRKLGSARFFLMVCVLAIAASMAACGGGSGSNGGSGSGGTIPVPTPPGTYTLTVTASFGSVTHSFPLTLTVK